VPAQQPAEADPIAKAQTIPGQLTLEQVQKAWDEVLVAVRQRNPTAEGALRSGCAPVEVSNNQVVVTFPYPFLREKLGDPQRKVEIQDALSQVLGSKCLVKLVLAGEHTPVQRTSSAPSTAPQDKAPPAPALDAKDLDQLTRWAKERGGETKVIEEP
jgi:hypothetical protein